MPSYNVYAQIELNPGGDLDEVADLRHFADARFEFELEAEDEAEAMRKAAALVGRKAVGAEWTPNPYRDGC